MTPTPAAMRAAEGIAFSIFGYAEGDRVHSIARGIDRECRLSETVQVLRALTGSPYHNGAGVPLRNYEAHLKYREEALDAARKLLAELERTP